MIEAAAEGAQVSGEMTLASANALLAEGAQLIAGNGKSAMRFDLAGVTEVDSSGLAVVFGWVREAMRLDKTVSISNLPKNLTSLAEVYGVSDLLPLS